MADPIQNLALSTEAEKGTGSLQDLELRTEAEKEASAGVDFVEWTFDSDVESWVVADSGGTFTQTWQVGGTIELDAETDPATDPRWQSPGSQTINGATARYVVVRLREMDAPSSYDWRCFYATSGHGMSASFYSDPPDPSTILSDGEWHNLIFDMHNLAIGGTDWADNTIIQIRIDFGNVGGKHEVDWVQVTSLPAALPAFHPVTQFVLRSSE